MPGPQSHNIRTAFDSVPNGALFSFPAEQLERFSQTQRDQFEGILVKAGTQFLRPAQAGSRPLEASRVVLYDSTNQPTREKLADRGIYATVGTRRYLEPTFRMFPTDVPLDSLRDSVNPHGRVDLSNDLLEFLNSGMVGLSARILLGRGSKSYSVVQLTGEGVMLAYLLDFPHPEFA